MGRIRRRLLISAGAIALIVGAFGLGWHLHRRSVAPPDKIAEALQRIRKSYYRELPDRELTDAALRGLVDGLDRNSEYMNPESWRTYEEEQIKARFGGLGVEVQADPAGGLRLGEPMEGSPAAAAGLLKGDLLLEADGHSLKGLPVNDAVARIRGPSGTPVKLTVRRDEQTFPLTVTRGVIRTKSVRGRMVEDGIGTIRISEFVEMMDLFDAEVERLRGLGMKALVLDLRFNRGGLLSECVELADRFLDEGLIVTTHGRGTPPQPYTAGKRDTLPPIPLAVLVNGESASASEIFAAAMQEHGRGVIVGSPTFGKGTVQTPFPMADGSRLKITTAIYTTPQGKSVDGRPLQPDLRVDLSAAEATAVRRNDPGARDYPLEEATEILRAALQKRPATASSRVLKQPS